MDCETAQEEILMSFERLTSSAISPESRDHIQGCPQCARFASRQMSLDQRLSALLTPAPRLSPSFRSAMGRRVRHQPRWAYAEVVPDMLHLVSCAVATLVLALSLPFEASVTISIGTITTVLTYFILALMRNSLEMFDEPER